MWLAAFYLHRTKDYNLNWRQTSTLFNYCCTNSEISFRYSLYWYMISKFIQCDIWTTSIWSTQKQFNYLDFVRSSPVTSSSGSRSSRGFHIRRGSPAVACSPACFWAACWGGFQRGTDASGWTRGNAAAARTCWKYWDGASVDGWPPDGADAVTSAHWTHPGGWTQCGCGPDGV